MNFGLKKTTKISFFTLTIIFLTTSLSIISVMGIVELDSVKTIRPGYAEAYTYSIQNYKNQRFTLSIFYDPTVPNNSDLDIIFLCVRSSTWTYIEDNSSLTLADIPASDYLFNDTYDGANRGGSFSVVIPSWEEWTFVWLNLNSISMLMRIKIEHQHILWWLFIVIPTIVIVGLAGYYILENVTKYQRARMDADKSYRKLGSRNEGERKRAVYWLQGNGTLEDLERLKEIINDENPLIRANAAKAIGGISKRVGDKSTTKQLIDLYNVEENPATKEDIVSALCDIADDKATKILEDYLLKDKNEILRFKIAESLETIGSPKSIPPLVKVFNSNSTDTLKIAIKRALDRIAKSEGTTTDSLIQKYS